MLNSKRARWTRLWIVASVVWVAVTLGIAINEKINEKEEADRIKSSAAGYTTAGISLPVMGAPVTYGWSEKFGWFAFIFFPPFGIPLVIILGMRVSNWVLKGFAEE